MVDITGTMGSSNNTDLFTLDMRVADGATAGGDHRALHIQMDTFDADADLFGLMIFAQTSNEATAGVYEAAIYIENQENTAGVMPDAIRIVDGGGVVGGITDGLDVSSTNITNAINIGANNIAGTFFDLDGSTGDITDVSSITSDGTISTTGDMVTDRLIYNTAMVVPHPVPPLPFYWTMRLFPKKPFFSSVHPPLISV